MVSGLPACHLLLHWPVPHATCARDGCVLIPRECSLKSSCVAPNPAIESDAKGGRGSSPSRSAGEGIVDGRGPGNGFYRE